ncbi:ORF6N domain-containing protein [Proteus terrae]|uniref:ORF6N domain-containing protein n=1 Tax=Proteus terrae TaxID=1574161 RepID=UPI0013201D57|nr:ORF6N domain-containing protein [Proteus terrae]QHD93227.1 ORF6N domain-containing protein [Proteus terrae subsp. cibarius]QJW51760.1 ORF6N domain-containing protein [Proteus terrae subsp. cibarius]
MKNELITIDNNNLPIIEWKGVRVVTTETLATGYSATEKMITNNFSRNKNRFVEGKHYFEIKGKELQELKRLPSLRGVVNKYASQQILWTERGAARHAKILETDPAWSFFEKMEEAYFRPIQTVTSDPTEMGLPDFLDPVSSALAWAEAKKESTQLSIELKEAKRTKSQISRSREASALGKLSAVTRKNRELTERLGESVKHATVTAVQNVAGIKYSPWSMRRWCKERNINVEVVPDPRFGHVKSWPAEAWLEVHGVDIKKLFGVK